MNAIINWQQFSRRASNGAGMSTKMAAMACRISARLAFAVPSAGYPGKPIRFLVPTTQGGGTEMPAQTPIDRLAEFGVMEPV